uniref:Phospholipid phosphatase 1 n=1 Tax=Sinocyclocheilus rhinocerous TaxID=307959 RepID=A0A673N5M6_9TELE
MFETRGIPFILLDIACLILAGLPLAAFNLGKIKPYQRGFFCNDESISYPFHTSTVTSTVLYTVGFTLPICGLLVSIVNLIKQPFCVAHIDSSICFCCRLSFYSGHSSFSMYCMLFLALYLQARMQTEWARLLRPMFQFFLIAASIYTGLSRVSDYKHHWSDVLTGLIQGAIVALLVVFCVSNFFKKNVEPQREAEIPHTTL